MIPMALIFPGLTLLKSPFQQTAVFLYICTVQVAVKARWGGALLPSPLGDLEVRVQDAQTYNQRWVEWWTAGKDGQPYPGRRITAALEYVIERYGLDISKRGIVLDGPSMGGAGSVVQTMIPPQPWRELIAYSTGRIGIILPRRVAQRDPGQYATLPPDNRANKPFLGQHRFFTAGCE